MDRETDDADASLAAIQAGDLDGLERLYRELRVPVFAVALAITRDRRAAEDVLHDTFVRVWSGAEGYRRGSRARAWVLAIARNLALDTLRRRRREIAVEDAHATAKTEPALDGMIVTQALLTLDRPEREIVALHELGGLTHAEIARELGLPPGTVRWKYRVALDRLRTFFAEHTDG
jgi:RNA polymerase sigma-70 factor, ECF subfamily